MEPESGNAGSIIDFNALIVTEGTISSKKLLIVNMIHLTPMRNDSRFYDNPANNGHPCERI